MTRYNLIATVLLIFFVIKNYAAPTDTTPSLVVTSTTETSIKNNEEVKKEVQREVRIANRIR